MDALTQLVEALRQELWRGGRLAGEAAAGDRERDEALFRELVVVRQQTVAMGQQLAALVAVEEREAVVHDMERMGDQVWAAVDRILLYTGSARGMAAAALCHFAVVGQAGLLVRVVAFCLAAILDIGVATVVISTLVGAGSLQTVGRLVACWRRCRRRQGGEQEAAEMGGAEPDPAGGGGWFSWLWGPPASRVMAPSDSPV